MPSLIGNKPNQVPSNGDLGTLAFQDGTVPAGALVGTTATQTLTNKTLTSPVINQMVDSQGGVLAPISSVMRNRIINGAMVIDQRNAGASVTPNGSYTLDRWRSYNTQTSKFTVQQNAGSVTPPIGFKNYLGVTSSSAYSVTSSDYFGMFQSIEGFNFADMDWGTANAKTITISFWVRSSLTGTFGGALNNAAFDRSYPFSYSISAANTWEYKTITIAGDTTGTWVGATNGVGVSVIFALGAGSTLSSTAGAWASGFFVSATGATSVVGTNGATFYITGVQLERGTQSTSFEYRQYGQELALCQRYLPCFNASASSQTVGSAYASSATAGFGTYVFKVTSRVAPTGIAVSNATHFEVVSGGSGNIALTGLTFSYASVDACTVATTVAFGQTANAGGVLRSSNASAQIQFNGCEL